MANYKDIITGTLSSLGGKVREVAEAGGVREIYGKGVDRAKSYGRIAKLSLELNSESEELRKVYTEIGKLCFEQNRLSPDPLYAGLFAQAEELIDRLHDKEDELNELKAEIGAEKAERDIEVEIGDFEDIVNATENSGKGD